MPSIYVKIDIAAGIVSLETRSNSSGFLQDLISEFIHTAYNVSHTDI
jgi:hypothetical protein